MNSKYFEILYKKYFKVLHSYSVRFVRMDNVAEDIVQDVFLDCWHRRESIDTSVNIKPYLYTLTRTKSIDYLRKSETKNVSLSEVDNDLDKLIFDSFLFDDEIDARNIEKVIDDTIAYLPPKCKAVFLLSREKGMKNRQIAEALNLNLKTVEKHITKALKQIKMMLKERGYHSFFYLFFMQYLSLCCTIF